MDSVPDSEIVEMGEGDARLPAGGVEPIWHGYRFGAREYDCEHYFFREMDGMACVYIFASLEDRGFWFPYYIGKSSKIKERLRWPDDKP